MYAKGFIFVNNIFFAKTIFLIRSFWDCGKYLQQPNKRNYPYFQVFPLGAFKENAFRDVADCFFFVIFLRKLMLWIIIEVRLIDDVRLFIH